jgi:uncharacterized protein YdeI (YjbR/CyaY-like superfamily)
MGVLNPKSFSTVLEATGTKLHWVIARVPVDLKKAWPGWDGRRVRGEINGFAFQTSLFPGSGGNCLTLLVNKKMQAGAKAGPGMAVKVRLEPVMSEPVVQVPAELTSALKSDRPLQQWFERLSPSMRKGVSQFVDQAKGKETRKIRADKMAESLMLSMEGESEVPPILRAAFQRKPLAREGWYAMTSAQRRNHLLGIFYMQTVHGRERRAAKAIEDAVLVAKRNARRRGSTPIE